MNVLVWAIALVIVVLLFQINERLWGKYKQINAGVLAIVIFALCGAAFYLGGWWMGSLVLIGSFALGAALHSPALWIARKLTNDSPDLGVAEYNRRKLRRLMRKSGSAKSLEAREGEHPKETRHMARTVWLANSKPEVQQVLKRHHATVRDLEAFYRRVEIVSLPPDLRELALANPAMLDWFLANSGPAEFQGQYVRNVNSLDLSVTLQLWAGYNPGGKEPSSTM